jgi:hypothetical protein
MAIAGTGAVKQQAMNVVRGRLASTSNLGGSNITVASFLKGI